MSIQHLANLLQTTEKQIQNITQLVYAVLANVCVKINSLQSTSQELNTYWLSNYTADFPARHLTKNTTDIKLLYVRLQVFSVGGISILITSSLQETTKRVVHHSLCTAYGRHRLTTLNLFSLHTGMQLYPFHNINIFLIIKPKF